jgi:hypothetical protein
VRHTIFSIVSRIDLLNFIMKQGAPSRNSEVEH